MLSPTRIRRHPSGLTLIELIVVIGILAVLAGFIVPLGANYVASSRITATNANLVLIRNAIMGTQDKPGFYNDTGQLPRTLADLFINPFASLPPTDPNYGLRTFNRDTGLGWRGPYLITTGGLYPSTYPQYIAGSGGYPGTGYGITGDPAVLDAWGHAIILQIPNQSVSAGTYSSPLAADLQFARLLSAGPNGLIDTPQNAMDNYNNPYPRLRGDDLILFLNHSDSDP